MSADLRYNTSPEAIYQFDEQRYTSHCLELAEKHAVFHNIISMYGVPVMLHRAPAFETLVHIILEQQVSLASAKAALNKLRDRLGTITPEGVLALTDEALRACYFSRQKSSYVRSLAAALVNRELDLAALENETDATVIASLTKLKGIGRWTADIYLIFVLKRADVFPLGDLAMVNAMKETLQLPKETTRERLMEIAEAWRPFRTIATTLFWHQYIKKRGLVI